MVRGDGREEGREGDFPANRRRRPHGYLMRFDRTAWLQELAERHGRMLFGAAYRVLGNAGDAIGAGKS